MTLAIAETTTRTIKPSALIVDDEALVLMFLEEKLQEMGFAVSTATTVDEALDVAHSKAEFTVAFIDLGLAGRSGLELIAELESLYPKLPIVIASGYGAMAARDLDGHHRAPVVLPKPYDAKKIMGVLTALGISIPHVPT